MTSLQLLSAVSHTSDGLTTTTTVTVSQSLFVSGYFQYVGTVYCPSIAVWQRSVVQCDLFHPHAS